MGDVTDDGDDDEYYFENRRCNMHRHHHSAPFDLRVYNESIEEGKKFKILSKFLSFCLSQNTKYDT